MSNRRSFIKKTSIGIAGTIIGSSLYSCNNKNNNSMSNIPIVISTWKHGFDANEKAYEIINNGGQAIDAVEEGVKVSEACLLYTSPSPRDKRQSRMPSSA